MAGYYEDRYGLRPAAAGTRGHAQAIDRFNNRFGLDSARGQASLNTYKDATGMSNVVAARNRTIAENRRPGAVGHAAPNSITTKAADGSYKGNTLTASPELAAASAQGRPYTGVLGTYDDGRGVNPAVNNRPTPNNTFGAPTNDIDAFGGPANPATRQSATYAAASESIPAAESLPPPTLTWQRNAPPPEQLNRPQGLHPASQRILGQNPQVPSMAPNPSQGRWKDWAMNLDTSGVRQRHGVRLIAQELAKTPANQRSQVLQQLRETGFGELIDDTDYLDQWIQHYMAQQQLPMGP